MRIAVTYENGNVFQHFGKSKEFKIYTVEENKVIYSKVISAGDAGHEALAEVLAEYKVDVLICGGLGDGAKNALSAAGIEVISGAAGEADLAVEAYLGGQLESQGVNCDHHDHHEEQESGCESNCGSCGGCGHHELHVIYDGKNAGKQCSVHYTGTLDDGTVFDSSVERNQPLDFVCGVGMMIKGFDKAVVDMEVGDEVDIHLTPSEAYGEFNPEAVLHLQIAELPGSENLQVGQRVALQDTNGRSFPVVVKEKTDTTIVLDANHELAGKALNFHIQLLSVVE